MVVEDESEGTTKPHPMRAFADSWDEPDHYAWMVGYLRGRGLATRVRVLSAVAIAGYVALPVSMLYSPAGPHGRWPRAAVVVVSGAVLLCAASLGWRWTSRRWSIVRSVIIATCTVVVCLSYTDPVVGLVGCTAFAMMGGYIAFFHSLRLQTLNLGLGLLTATVLATRALMDTHDVIATLNLYVVVALAVVALPATAHVLAHFLGGDLDTSDTDSLTGLLNRRAFYRATHLLAATNALPAEELTVTMIDLDDFKGLNDTYGHRAGDTALVEVSRLLTEHTSERAAVARIGGEEFLIADLSDPETAHRCATQLCAAIAGMQFHVTASIGIASTDLPAHSFGDDHHSLIDHLIDLADTVMYEAKRSGGNQVHTAPPR